MEATTSRRNRLGLLAAVIVVAVVAAAGALIATRDDDGGGGASAAGVPADVLSGPGTELGDGLTVASGSSLIGPVVVTATDGTDEIAAWSGLVLVEDDALEVWQSYAGQLADRFPDSGIDASQAPGCAPGDENLNEAEVCSLDAQDTDREVDMSLVSVPGDVTGRYLLRLSGQVYEPSEYDDNEEIPTGTNELPEPQSARERPRAGEALAPATTAYEGDDEEYVVVEGSELLAQYSAGSITGGFSVLLRVSPGADLDSVVDAYVEQADQVDDTEATEEPSPPDVIEHEGTTVSHYDPPGGAGGYTGDVTVVDRPDGDDYILFELFND
jgi:hypothetical protein